MGGGEAKSTQARRLPVQPENVCKVLSSIFSMKKGILQVITVGHLEDIFHFGFSETAFEWFCII